MQEHTHFTDTGEIEDARIKAEALKQLRIDMWNVTEQALTAPRVQITPAEEVEAKRLSIQFGILTRALERRGITPANVEQSTRIEHEITMLESSHLSDAN